jgi:alpha-glucosidase
MAAGLGVSGQAFVGADVGGFQGNSNAELYLRWMQYGALTPFFRNHSELGNVDQYAWSWGEVIEGYVREAIRLRYRLIPYLYAAFSLAAETGAPVQRPMIFADQYDRTAQDIDDQYLFGPDLLVAPVYEPGCTARQVYLPAGTWYDWTSGEVHTGPSYVVAATPMSSIPVYARGGAVIPMWPEAPASTAGYQPRTIELHVFVPAEDGRHTSRLHEDDGLTFAARQGARVSTTFELSRQGNRLRLAAQVEGSGYPEFVRDGFQLVVHGADPELVEFDGVAVSRSGGGFHVANTGQGFTAEFDARPSIG